MTNRHKRNKRISSRTIVSSRPFKKGVADYRKGRWSEVAGSWRGVDIAIVYEAGRLSAAVATANGEDTVSIDTFVYAVARGDILITATR